MSRAGGTLSAGGTVRLDAGQRFPADMTLSPNNVRYTDGSLSRRDCRATCAQGAGDGDRRVAVGTIDLTSPEIRSPRGSGASARGDARAGDPLPSSAGCCRPRPRQGGRAESASTGGGSNLADIRAAPDLRAAQGSMSSSAASSWCGARSRHPTGRQFTCAAAGSPSSASASSSRRASAAVGNRPSRSILVARS